jgi:HK97 family phage prohead protease
VSAPSTLPVDFEVKALDDSGGFDGYASVFDVRDSVADIVVKGAFNRTLKSYETRGKMPKMLWQHNTAEPIGVWSEMREDERGLYVKGTLLLDIQRGREAYALLKAGALDSMSIGYTVKQADYDKKQGVRILKDVEIYEVSLVTFPANTSAIVTGVKAMLDEDELPSVRQMERLLCGAGFTRTQAIVVINDGFKALVTTRDAGTDALTRLESRLDHFIKLHRVSNGTGHHATGEQG